MRVSFITDQSRLEMIGGCVLTHYYMAVGAGLNPDLAAVLISSRLSLLFCILMQSVGLDFFR